MKYLLYSLILFLSFNGIESNGRMITSKDNGKTWEKISINQEFGLWDNNFLKYFEDEGLYFGINILKQFVSSKDGIEWNIINIKDNPIIKNVIKSSEGYCAVGNNSTYASKNGLDWIKTYEFSYSLSDLAYGNGVYIAVGKGLAIAKTCWDFYPLKNLDNGVNKIYFTGMEFIAYPSHHIGELHRFFTTVDGKKWTYFDLGIPYGAIPKILTDNILNTYIIANINTGINFKIFIKSKHENDWRVISDFLPRVRDIFLENNLNLIAALDWNRIVKSEDGGLTWKMVFSEEIEGINWVFKIRDTYIAFTE